MPVEVVVVVVVVVDQPTQALGAQQLLELSGSLEVWQAVLVDARPRAVAVVSYELGERLGAVEAQAEADLVVATDPVARNRLGDAKPAGVLEIPRVRVEVRFELSERKADAR